MIKTGSNFLSGLLALIMIASLFAVVPFTAGATETYETSDLTQHWHADDDDYADAFNTDHFSFTPNNTLYGGDDFGWRAYPFYNHYFTIAARNGETITKIVMTIDHSDGNPGPIVVAGKNTLSVSTNGNVYT